MELYLFRHGIAEDAKPGSPDSARELTDDGRDRTAAVAKMARKSGVRPAVIASSPYIRALQTARIAAEQLDYKGEVAIFNSLAPHGSAEAVWKDVRDHADAPSILLAGHEPLMSALVAFCLNAPSLRVDMKKAALVRIDIDGAQAHPHGMLRWMLVPRMV